MKIAILFCGMLVLFSLFVMVVAFVFESVGDTYRKVKDWLESLF